MPSSISIGLRSGQCSPRKRRPSSDADANESPLKKRRIYHPDFPPLKYWKELADWDKIYLTRQALLALDRYGINKRPAANPKSETCKSLKRSTKTTSRKPEHLLPAQTSCCPTISRELRRFASRGGPDTSALRGYPFPESQRDGMSSEPLQDISRRRKRDSRSPRQPNGTPDASSTRRSKKTKTTGPYDHNFQHHLIRHGIYPALHLCSNGTSLPEPDNKNEILSLLKQPRRSLSPSRFSEEAFLSFKKNDQHAAKEPQVMSRVVPVIEGNLEDPKCAAGQIVFNNFDHLTDGTLAPGNPDVYYGANPDELRQEVHEQLKGQIQPSTQDDLPMAPNFLLHVKGPDGNSRIAARQACYDGALGARGMLSLQSYGQQKLQYDDKAYTLTSIYQDGQLKMYTSHPVPPSVPGDEPFFAMTHIKSWAVASDVDTFRQGAAAYRNGRDWAKRQRDDAINKANERYATMTRAGQQIPPVTTKGYPRENGPRRSRTSTDSGFSDGEPSKT